MGQFVIKVVIGRPETKLNLRRRRMPSLLGLTDESAAGSGRAGRPRPAATGRDRLPCIHLLRGAARRLAEAQPKLSP